MPGPRVVVFGDIVNDIVAVPRAAIRPDTDTPSTIRPRPGGSAANVAAWLGSLGVPADFVGSVGVADLDLHAQELRQHGVEPHLTPAPGLPTSTIVIVVEGDHRTMLTERGANSVLHDSLVTEALLAEAAVLHLSGYNLLDGPKEAGLRSLIDRGHAAGVKVSINPGSAGFIADFGAERFAEGIAGTDFLFANLDEGRLLTGEHDPERVAAALAARHGTVLLSLGSAGAVIADGTVAPVPIAATPTRVLDPTGAGDAMSAGFLQRWLATGDSLDAARHGMLTAARAVMVLGGRPPI